MSRKRLIATAIILTLVLAIGGILAYFTDVETKTNKFTMGNVKIQVDEPGFPDEGITDVTPNTEYVKDPTITNKGTTEVYAFAEVTIPYDTVTTGEETVASEKELFEVLHGDPSEVGINSTWVEVGTPTKNEEGKTYTHVYAYVGDNGTTLKALAKDQKTNTVFDKVRFIDIKETNPEDSAVQGKTFNVVVSGYGIQTTDLGLSGEDLTNPEKVWPLVKK